MDDITGGDFRHVKGLVENLKLKAGDYHDLYVWGKKYLLIDVFRHFQDVLK